MKRTPKARAGVTSNKKVVFSNKVQQQQHEIKKEHESVREESKETRAGMRAEDNYDQREGDHVQAAEQLA